MQIASNPSEIRPFRSESCQLTADALPGLFFMFLHPFTQFWQFFWFITCLGTMGTWTYIEGTEKDVLFQGFVPTECLSGTVTTLREAEKAIVGSWKLYAGTSIDASRIVFHEDGSVTGRSTLESGREVEWNGSWQLDYYDSNRSRYWNDSEFELTLSRGTSVELYGLRICRQSAENGKIKYALVLSDGAKTSGMVLTE